MRDEKTGLYYHGYDESRQMYWADPVTGCSPNFWLRAMGWFMVAMVDVLERMDEQLYNEYRGIMAMLKQTIEDVHKFQDEETGMFWQVMDHPGVEGNYLETSADACWQKKVKLRRDLFEHETEMAPIDAVITYDLLERLYTLSDQAAGVGTRIEILLTRK